MKRCEVCSEEFERREGEYPSAYEKRRTCTDECAVELRARSVRKCSTHRPTTFIAPKSGAAMSHEQIAQALGLSRTRVQQIEREALAKLRPIFEEYRS